MAFPAPSHPGICDAIPLEFPGISPRAADALRRFPQLRPELSGQVTYWESVIREDPVSWRERTALDCAVRGFNREHQALVVDKVLIPLLQRAGFGDPRTHTDVIAAAEEQVFEAERHCRGFDVDEMFAAGRREAASKALGAAHGRAASDVLCALRALDATARALVLEHLEPVLHRLRLYGTAGPALAAMIRAQF